jgi:NADH:ubiquinone oxidoreductase subunit K
MTSMGMTTPLAGYLLVAALLFAIGLAGALGAPQRHPRAHRD